MSIETLSAAAGLDQLERSASSIQALLAECSKALTLLNPNDGDGEEAPEASCPVFLAVRLIDDQVFLNWIGRSTAFQCAIWTTYCPCSRLVSLAGGRKVCR